MPYASLPIGKFCRKHDVSLACIRLLKADINTTDDLYCAYKEHFYGPHVTQFGRRILHRLRTAVADLDHAFASVCQLRGEKYKSGYLVALAEKEIWSPALIGSHVSQSVAEGPKEITVLYNERVARSIESLDNLIAARRKELSALSCDKPSDPTFHLKVAHTEKENKLSTLDKCAHHSEHGASTLKSLDVLMDSRRKDLSALRPRNPGSCKPLLRATYSYRCSSPSACAFSSSSITRSPSTRAATFSLPPPYALSPQPQIPVSAPSPSGPFSATLTSKPPALPPERKALAPASLAEDSADGMARAWQRAVALLNTWLLRILRNAMSILMPKNPLVCGNASTSVVAQPGRVQTTSPLSPSSPDTGAEEDTPTTVATTIVAAEPLLASPTSDPFAAFTLCTPSCPPTSSAALSTLATLPMPITSPTSVYFPLLATDAAIDHVDTKDNLVIAVDIATIKDEDRNGGALETVHEEVQAWITKEKLYSSLPDLLAARSIYTLDQVRSMSHDLICEIGNALKPLPNKRFIKAIYELKTLVETKKVEMPEVKPPTRLSCPALAVEDSAVSGNEETKQASAISSPSEELAAWIAQEKLPQSLVKVLSEHSISSLEQVNGISSEKLITVTKDFKPLARKKIEQCVIAVQQGLTWKEYYARQLSGRDVLEGVQYDGWK